MKISNNLLNYTKPILEETMANDASVSTTTHNPGVIGDALFKKAQLDLNIATLQSDTALRKAQLMGDMEHNRSRLEYDNTALRVDTELRIQQLKAESKARKEARKNARGTFGQKILGAVAGAGAGAVTGFAVGGPWGAAAGGAVGGALAWDSYEKKGLEGGDRTVTQLGTVATLSSTLSEGYKNHRAKKDTKTQLDTYSKAASALKALKAQPSSAQNQAAIAEKEAEMEGIKVKMLENSVDMTNPEIGLKYVGAIDKMSENSATPEVGFAQRTTHAINEVNTKGGFDKLTRDEQNQWRADRAADYSMTYGQAPSPGIMQSLEASSNGGYVSSGDSGNSPQVTQRGGGIGTTVNVSDRGLDRMNTNSAGAPAIPTYAGSSTSADSSEVLQTPSARAGTSASSNQSISSSRVVNRSQGPAVAQDQQYSQDGATRTAPDHYSASTGVMAPSLTNTKGIEMDTINSMIETNTKLGTEAAKVLSKDEESTQQFAKESPKGKLARADERILVAAKKIEASGMQSEVTREKFQSGLTAKDALDSMIENVESGRFPTDSARKARGMKSRREGIDVTAELTAAGTGAGVFVGSKFGPRGAVTGAGVGAAAGAKAGAATKGAFKGWDFGRLSDEEEIASDDMDNDAQEFKQAYNKLQEPGVMRDPEEARLDKLLGDSRISKKELLNRLHKLKDKVAGRMEHLAKAATSDRSSRRDDVRLDATTRAEIDARYQGQNAAARATASEMVKQSLRPGEEYIDYPRR